MLPVLHKYKCPVQNCTVVPLKNKRGLTWNCLLLKSCIKCCKLMNNYKLQHNIIQEVKNAIECLNKQITDIYVIFDERKI